MAAQCPYFLPSAYQSDVQDELDSAIVYGGHAAFSCPSKTNLVVTYNYCNYCKFLILANDQVTMNNKSSYSTDICIGNGAASLQPSTAMNRLCTLLTILVCVVVGIILR